MIVVADTSPLNYLAMIDEIHVLPKLFRRIIIPPRVRHELETPDAPDVVRRWISAVPEWIEEREPGSVEDTSLSHLDAGERQAILLAQEFRAEKLLIDERLGRQEALRRFVPVVGTLGILRAGALAGLLDLRRAVLKLQETSFRVERAIIDRLLSEATKEDGGR